MKLKIGDLVVGPSPDQYGIIIHIAKDFLFGEELLCRVLFRDEHAPRIQISSTLKKANV